VSLNQAHAVYRRSSTGPLGTVTELLVKRKGAIIGGILIDVYQSIYRNSLTAKLFLRKVVSVRNLFLITKINIIFLYSLGSC